MGDHETWIFEAVNVASTQIKGIHLAKTVLNTNVNVSERVENVNSKFHDPYGKQCNIKRGGVAGLSAVNGNPHPHVHSCNHYDNQLRSVR